MKALVYEAPKKLAMRDVPMPESQNGECIIRVEYVGICGSDMHGFLGHDERRPAPLILGHEAAGIVHSGEHQGMRVTVNPLVTCGACEYCQSGQDNLCPNRQILSMPPREGAFAEYIAIPFENLVEIPDHVPSEKAALAEPLACGWNAVIKAKAHYGGDLSNKRALVFGGGAIGLGAALCLRAHDCQEIVIIEPHQARREFLQSLPDMKGMQIIHPDEMAHQPLFHLAIDGVGFAATRAQATQSLKAGGVICHIGLGSNDGGLDIRRMTLQEITFIGCYTYTKQDFRETAQAIFDNRLGALDWTDIRPLSKGTQAFADLQSGAVARPKIILKP